jgi:hypothetical protein
MTPYRDNQDSRYRKSMMLGGFCLSGEERGADFLN